MSHRIYIYSKMSMINKVEPMDICASFHNFTPKAQWESKNQQKENKSSRNNNEEKAKHEQSRLRTKNVCEGKVLYNIKNQV